MRKRQPVVFFFFKQKTAYEVKECDWSSDVCSSDLRRQERKGEKGESGFPPLLPPSTLGDGAGSVIDKGLKTGGRGGSEGLAGRGILRTGVEGQGWEGRGRNESGCGRQGH